LRVMPRKMGAPAALPWASRDDDTEDQCAVSYLSETGKFEKDGFKIGPDGVMQSPAQQGAVSTLRREDLEMGPVLGKGACSEVRMATHVTGQKIAVKVFDVNDESRRTQLLSELHAMLGKTVPHFVNIWDAFYYESRMYVCLEFMDAGSLESLMTKRPQPSEAVAAAVIKQVLQGLGYLHRVAKQVHRDLKPGNVLLNFQGIVKISDMGMSKQMNPDFGTAALAQTFLGTTMYMSPERMKGEPYSYSSDIWAAGIMAFELAHYQHPYKGYGGNYIELMQTILERPPPGTVAAADTLTRAQNQRPTSPKHSATSYSQSLTFPRAC